MIVPSPRNLLLALPIAGTTAMIAGCVAGATEPCRKPPKVECAKWSEPTPDFWRNNHDEDAAANAIVGVRNCTNLIGQPLNVAYARYGKPFPIDGTALSPRARVRVWGWQTKTGMYLAYDRSSKRRIEKVVLYADTASSSDPGWNYCGAPWRTLTRYERP